MAGEKVFFRLKISFLAPPRLQGYAGIRIPGYNDMGASKTERTMTGGRPLATLAGLWLVALSTRVSSTLPKAGPPYFRMANLPVTTGPGSPAKTARTAKTYTPLGEPEAGHAPS